MNWLLIAVIVILGGFTVRGYQKGIIKMIISVLSMVLSLIIAFIAAPVISENLCNSETVLNYVSERVNEGLGIEKSCVDITDSVADGIKGTNKKGTANMNAAQKEELIGYLALPEKIKSTMLENTAKIVSIKGKVTAIKFAKAISDYLAKIMIKAITYIVVFLVFKLILRFVTMIFNFVDKLPVIENMNQMAGGIAGAVSGLFIVWVGFLLLFLFSTTSLGTICYQYINDSKILTFLYDNNILIHWILRSMT